MSTFFGIQMAGRQGNLLLLRKIFPYSDLGIVLIGDNIGFYIVSLVGQVIIKYKWKNIFKSFPHGGELSSLFSISQNVCGEDKQHHARMILHASQSLSSVQAAFAGLVEGRMIALAQSP